jgi:molybdate transport system permease protein
MDWQAARVSLTLAACTAALLLPPTVIGFYLLVTLGQGAPVGAWLATNLSLRLVFSFEGLLLASVLVNLPFMVQPLQRAFAAIPASLREAAWVCGLSPWRAFWKIELPLAWPGLLAGVVLMLGGSIAGETKTLSIAIYDRVQAFDLAAAHLMALLLVACSLAALALVFAADKVRPLQEK